MKPFRLGLDSFAVILQKDALAAIHNGLYLMYYFRRRCVDRLDHIDLMGIGAFMISKHTVSQKPRKSLRAHVSLSGSGSHNTRTLYRLSIVVSTRLMSKGPYQNHIAKIQSLLLSYIKR